MVGDTPDDPFGFLVSYFQKRARPPVVTRLVGREVCILNIFRVCPPYF